MVIFDYSVFISKSHAVNLFINLSSYRPNTGASPFEEEEADLYHKYEKISPAEAGIDDITIIDGKLVVF